MPISKKTAKAARPKATSAKVAKVTARPKATSAKTVKKSVAKKAAAKKVAKKTVANKVTKATARPKTTSAATKKTTATATKKTAKAARPKATTAKAASERLLVGEGEGGARLDKYLDKKLENASRTRIQKWMERGAVTVNGEVARKSRPVEQGDVIVVTRPEESVAGNARPENIPLEIVYEDKYLVVVNKPKGLVTHPGHGVPGGTLANALLHHYKTMSDFGGADRPGIVHRLDRDTSGLLVAARDNVTHAALSAMLAERTISRTYQALVWREPAPSGTFDAPLGRHPKDPVKRAVIVPTHRGIPGKPAVTHYRVLDWYQFAAHVEVTLDTGRTHQIRVHFAHAGHPVAGDTLYGGGEPMLGRVPPLFQTPAAGLLKRLGSQALHAVRLSFTHPRTKKKLAFESPLPQEFKDALKHLEKFRREPEADDDDNLA